MNFYVVYIFLTLNKIADILHHKNRAIFVKFFKLIKNKYLKKKKKKMMYFCIILCIPVWHKNNLIYHISLLLKRV
jgi:hypothetical protein